MSMQDQIDLFLSANIVIGAHAGKDILVTCWVILIKTQSSGIHSK